jgi:hypothetical protein
MSPTTSLLSALLLQTLACAATANDNGGEGATASECQAQADGACLFEDPMRLQLMQESQTTIHRRQHAPAGGALGAGTADAHVQAAARSMVAVANATVAATGGVVSVAQAAVEAKLASNLTVPVKLEGAKANLTAKAAKANQTAKQLPGIDGVISSITDAISGTVSDATTALIEPIENAVNSTLTEINDEVNSLLTQIILQKEEMLVAANKSWEEFVLKLNETMEETLAAWNLIPWDGITSSLEAVGASGLVPAEFSDSLATIADFADILANFSDIAPELVNSSYSQAQEMTVQYLQPLLMEMGEAVQVIMVAKESMKLGFAQLVDGISTGLTSVPGMSLVPTEVIESLQTSLAGLQETVNNVADMCFHMVHELTDGLKDALEIALGPIDLTKSGAPRRAARLGGFLAPAALVLAFKGLL